MDTICSCRQAQRRGQPAAIEFSWADRLGAMMNKVRWIHGETHTRCPMCGDESVKEQIVEACFGLGCDVVVAARCSRCASITIDGGFNGQTRPDDPAIDRAIDVYIEQ